MSKEALVIMKALSDPTRLSMVKEVWQKGEISCQDLSAEFSLSQPTMSHHIRKLVDANVFVIRKEGVAHYYSVNEKILRKLGITISKLFATQGT